MPIPTASSTYNWWEYSRWIRNIARNARITYPTGAELTAMRTFVALFYNPADGTGTRNEWLVNPIHNIMTNQTGNYSGALTNEPAAIIVKMVDVIGRDLKRVPPSDTEIGYCDTLIAATGDRRLGTGPLFGGIGGSMTTP